MLNHTKHLRPRSIIRTPVFAALASIIVLLGPLGTADAGSNPSVSPQGESSSSLGDIANLPISFQVKNVNRSKVQCASDGETYTVRGHLVGPSKMLQSRNVNAATLYLHGLSFGEFFWNFQQAQGYNYAVAQAGHGQVSVVIDRLGYNSSDKPDGNSICVGSRADIAHQMVMDLRTGSYQLVPSGNSPRFAKVVLAGHSYGGQIAEVEAYSFGDIDGMIVLGYADRVQSRLLKQNAAYAAQVCATGGLHVNATGPGGYAPFGPPSGAPAALFHSALPPVEQAALQLLTTDPCGDVASFPNAVKVDLKNVPAIKVPVLIITGGADALFPPPAGPNQATLFTGSRSVSQTTLPDTAHAVTFERTHNQLVKVVNNWLRQHITKRDRD